MAKDIAVYVNDTGNTASLNEPGKIVIYRRTKGNWQVLRDQEFCLNQNQGLRGLRSSMQEAKKFLADCKIFVGLSILGIPYFELEKAQCSIWEFEGNPGDFLDYILDKEETVTGEDSASSNVPLPLEVADGRFQISLKEIQTNNAGITSKQVLMPFLRTKDFYSLEITCNHIPPWLETELLAGDYSCLTERLDKDTVKLTLGRKCYQ